MAPDSKDKPDRAAPGGPEAGPSRPPSFTDQPTVVERPGPPPSDGPKTPLESRINSIDPGPDEFDYTTEDALARQKKITYAVAAVALIALVIGLLPGGKITASDIEDGAIVSAKIADQAVGANNLSPDAISADELVGPIGPTGPAGPRGRPGSAGAGSETEIVVSETILLAGASKQVTASCPSGKSIVSGGATVGGEGLAFLRASGPDPDKVDANRVRSWSAEAVAAPGSRSPWKLSVTLICSAAKATDGVATEQVAPLESISGLNDPGAN